MAVPTFVVLAVAVASVAWLSMVMSPIAAVKFDAPPLRELIANNKLQNVRRLGEGDLLGPESLATSPDGNYIYAGLMDGRIVRIGKDEKWETVVRTGEDVEGCGKGGAGDANNMEHICGRPLGLRFVTRSTVLAQPGPKPNDKVLVVCDAYKGLLMVEGAESGHARIVVLASRAKGDEEDFHLLNDLEEVNGNLYFTETSTKFQRRRIFYSAFEAIPAGRLLTYDKHSATAIVVKNKLLGPNGLTTTHDGQGLLIVSTLTVSRYDLASGEISEFAQTLGTGDNIHAAAATLSGDKVPCYWAGWGSKYAKPFSLVNFLADKVWLRKFVTAVLPYDTLVSLVPKYGMVGVLDTNGEVIEVFQDPTGQTSWISEAHAFNGKIYLGSWINPYLGVLESGTSGN